MRFHISSSCMLKNMKDKQTNLVVFSSFAADNSVFSPFIPLPSAKASLNLQIIGCCYSYPLWRTGGRPLLLQPVLTFEKLVCVAEF